MEIAIVIAIAVLAIGIVVVPLLRHGERTAGLHLSDEAIDAEVARYRSAIAHSTLCEHCLAANAPGSRYCGDCGRALQ